LLDLEDEDEDEETDSSSYSSFGGSTLGLLKSRHNCYT
jgi:hypothetical protein